MSSRQQSWAIYSKVLASWGINSEDYQQLSLIFDDEFPKVKNKDPLKQEQYFRRQLAHELKPKFVETLSDKGKLLFEQFFQVRIEKPLPYNLFFLGLFFNINSYEIFKRFESYHDIIGAVLFVRKSFEKGGRIWLRRRKIYANQVRNDSAVYFRATLLELKLIQNVMKSLGFKNGKIQVYGRSRNRAILPYYGLDQTLRFLKIFSPKVEESKIKRLKEGAPDLWEIRMRKTKL